MPNDTVRANAQAMPIDRRAALGSLAGAAGALLAVPRAKAAGSDDAEVFAAVRKLYGLVRSRVRADERLMSLNRELPDRPQYKLMDGSPMDKRELWRGKNLMKLMETFRIDEGDVTFGPAIAHYKTQLRAELEFNRAWGEAKERLNYEEAQAEFDAACSAEFNAARALLQLRPKTVAGLRAIAGAVSDVGILLDNKEGAALVAMLVEAPALQTEA